MQPDFWHQRWADQQIGFHQSTPTPLLLKHWSALGIAPGATVFVPLAGKSLDMAWLAAQGHRVLGVELSQRAVDDFMAGRVQSLLQALARLRLVQRFALDAQQPVGRVACDQLRLQRQFPHQRRDGLQADQAIDQVVPEITVLREYQALARVGRQRSGGRFGLFPHRNSYDISSIIR